MYIYIYIYIYIHMLSAACVGSSAAADPKAGAGARDDGTPPEQADGLPYRGIFSAEMPSETTEHRPNRQMGAYDPIGRAGRIFSAETCSIHVILPIVLFFFKCFLRACVQEKVTWPMNVPEAGMEKVRPFCGGSTKVRKG